MATDPTGSLPSTLQAQISGSNRPTPTAQPAARPAVPVGGSADTGAGRTGTNSDGSQPAPSPGQALVPTVSSDAEIEAAASRVDALNRREAPFAAGTAQADPRVDPNARLGQIVDILV